MSRLRIPVTPFVLGFSLAAAAGTVWMEGETYTSTSFPPDVLNAAGWGNRAVLSNGKWLNISIDAGKVAEKVPEGGASLRYVFTADEAGTYDVWARIGYEYVRTAFEWRVDSEEWTEVRNDDPAHLTQDLMLLQDWCEVGWSPLGTCDLAAGGHTLELRIRRPYKDAEKKQADRVIFAIDAVVVAPKGGFRPNGPHVPGTEWRTQADRDAEAFRFELPEAPADGARAELSLAGTWQYARWCEDEPIYSLRDMDEASRAATEKALPGGGSILVRADGSPVWHRAGPIPEAPAADALDWSSIAVPGDRNHLRPDQSHAHRYFYRTRLFVPASWQGGSLYLDFERNNLLSSVFINGQLVAASDAAASGFHADISSAVKAGEVNEIWVGMKDAFYAYDPPADKKDLRLAFNLPHHFLGHVQGISWRLDFPTANSVWTGIFQGVKVIASPAPAYADDVYVIPSVDDGALAVEVAVRGGTAQDGKAEVSAKVLDAGGATVLELGPVAVDVPTEGGAESVATLKADWADARRWSPEDPYLYTCVATVRAGGRADVSSVPFGFRQWKVDGRKLLLNGVPWQMRATTDYHGCGAGEAEKAVEFWKRSGQTMFRMMYQNDWGGMTREGAFDFFDRKGVPVRAEAGFFDGEVAAYGLVEDELQPDGSRKSVYRRELFRNVMKQTAAGMRRYRRHPCIFSWQLENEIVFINTRNFGWLDRVEPAIKELAALVAGLDKQGRPQMVEGGRALMDQSLPVNGCHYEMTDLRRYPDAAYSLEAMSRTSGSQPWPMAVDKPVFLNEEYFAPGNPVSYYAEVGGEGCFLGRTACRPATALIARMMTQGFRWQELAGWHYWMGVGNADESYWNDFQPVCALVREWTHTVASGAPVTRTVMVRNDNTFDASPIAFEWDFTVDGARKSLAGGSETLEVPCGGGVTTSISFKAPKVRVRTEGTLSLRCRRGGEIVFEERKRYAVFPGPERLERALRRGKVLFWGAEDSATLARLRSLGLSPVLVDSLDAAAGQDFNLLVVDAFALRPRDATDPRWMDFAASGRRVLVLEQERTLHFQAVPADISATDHSGAFAFPQNPDHPAFAGLESGDFSLWTGGHGVYTNAFVPPTRGADSLVQCGPALADCTLAQCTPGEGLILLSQLALGTKLETEPVAGILFDNLVRHGLSYRPLRRPVAVLLPPGPRLDAITGSGLQHEVAADAADALAKAPGGIVVFDGSKAGVEAFLALGEKALEDFMAAGGWLVPWNVGTDSLEAFNRLAGTDYILRPFRREKVEIPVPRDPLLSGLSQRDVTLFSGERIFGWVSDCFVADDTFSGVVDLEDVAPFATGFGIPGPGRERESQTVVNGLTSSEAWRYIVYQEMSDANALPVFKWTLARPETITQIGIAPNGHYRGLHEVKLVFDGNEADARLFTFAPYGNDGGGRQDIEIEPAVRASTVELRPVDLPAVSSDRAVTGIDNLWIKVRRDEARHARSVGLLNVGGLVKHPRGRGGILLNQILLKEHEEVPENGAKKRNILVTLLRNLGGVFAASRDIRPGAGLTYEPVSLEGEGIANLYLSGERGFPDKTDDLSRLPLGEQRMAGVLYRIRDFRTSPLESAVTLRGMPGVNAPEQVSIPVGTKADALFFLHGLYPNQEWKPQRATDAPPSTWVYEIRYADGGSEVFAVAYGRHVAPYKAASEPTGLPDAALAWSATAPSGEGANLSVYSAQWTNPKPEAAIESVTLKYSDQGDRWGRPILLGITAATAAE